ncbi:MAG: NADH-quinone oxidoreductase subunit C [Lacibacter sp.]
MNKIETTVETLLQDIGNFYRPDRHHFIVMNAVEVGSQLEVQWFFCDYAPPCAETVFYMRIDPATEVPSIRSIVASAWVAEAELVDLMNIRIEGTQKGFVLEPDFNGSPLRKGD